MSTTARLLALARLKAGIKSNEQDTSHNVPTASTTITPNQQGSSQVSSICAGSDSTNSSNTAVANVVTKIAPALTATALTNALTTPIPNAHLIPELTAVKQSNSMDTYVLHEAIANLQQLILTAHPTLPVLLRTIHKQVRDDPELVTILSEEELGIIVNGLKVQTNTEIVATAVKSSTTAKLKKKILTVDLF